MSVAAVGRVLRRLRRDRSGLALIEFAFTLPLLLAAGLYGAETANLALVNLKISQIALNLADNASRVGVTPLSTEQLREVDMNDVLQAARYQGKSLNLTTNGRIILSSLENVQQSYDSNGPVQRIHWQRCLGMKGNAGADAAYRSSYGVSGASGTSSTTATYDPTAGVNTGGANDNSSSHPGSLAPNGMGNPGAMISAPSGSAVIFVEVNYLYTPLISNYLVASNAARIHYIASFIVRDNRDFSEIYNPSPATTASTCDKYTT